MDSWIILLGMMGAGKSTVGKALASKLGVMFQDTDRMLEHRLGRPIPQLFGLYGEETFRAHETSVLRSLERQPGVLATGGGIVLREQNWVEFERLGTTVFLSPDPDILKQRLRTSKKRRPLLETADWEQTFDELYSKRIDLYRKADHVLQIENADFEAILDRIVLQIEEWA